MKKFAGNEKRKAGIRGSKGLVGTAINNSLSADGWEVIDISRNFSVDDIRGLDLLINLAGHTINCRWSRNEKSAIRRSRIETTAKLTEAINYVAKMPLLFLYLHLLWVFILLQKQLLRKMHLMNYPLKEGLAFFQKYVKSGKRQRWRHRLIPE